MKPINIRTYQPGDETPIINTWNQSLPQDPISERIFLERVLCDPNFDPEGALVAVDDLDQIIGFLLAIVRRTPLEGTNIEPDQGWITSFFVVPAQRQRGVGQALFQAAERHFRARGRTRIDFASYAPNYFLPGLDQETYPEGLAFLEQQGFRILYSPVAMDRNIVGYQYPSDVRQLEQKRRDEGYTFSSLRVHHVAEVIHFASNRFNPDWGRAIREAIVRGVPLERFLVCTNPQGRIVGFCMFGGYDGISDRFGPFGVDENERGKGLGKILLHKCMHVMRSHGLHNLWFLWTGETSPAGHLYLRAGFEISRKFHVMRKELS